ncbi:MAG TPA: cellulase family glycosylhydrolase [Acidobacteriaceae bacterium]
MNVRRTVSLFAILFLTVSASAQAPSADAARATAFHRAATLTRGINASGWFGGWGDYSLEHTSKWITADDIAEMRKLGFTYVRIGVDPMYFRNYGNLDAPTKAALWKRLDAAVDSALAAGLAVDLCIFPRDDFKAVLSTDSNIGQFLFLWTALAKHYADRDPDHLFLELMNESEVQDPYRWIGLQSALVTAIRRVDPVHTILASGAHYDSLDDLLTTEPLSDANVIYTFHFYEPYQFTHQGATWGSPEWLFYKDIPFPATVAQLQPTLDAIPNDLARYKLFLYAAGNWNAESIRQRITFAANWGREHNVPILCNEFGAFRDTAPPESRARYIEAVRTALEANHIGWAMWDWSGNFGLVTRENGHINVDPAIAHALGLNSP